jgi:hypothetical protein
VHQHLPKDFQNSDVVEHLTNRKMLEGVEEFAILDFSHNHFPRDTLFFVLPWMPRTKKESKLT